MGKFFCLLALVFAVFCTSQIAMAQGGYPLRIGTITLTNSTVTTGVKAVIPAANVGSGPMNFDICHDAASTDAYIAVGKAVDVSDGLKLKPGVCWSCPYCSAAILKNMNILGTTSGGTAYTVIQYKP